MGIFHVPVTVSGVTGERSVTLDVLVDTGDTISLIPPRILNELGIRPHRQARFSLASQSDTVLDIGSARLQIDGAYETLPIAFGPDDAEPLLGALALEAFGFAVDTVNRKLVKVDMKLK